jgi:hypothetical protein
MRTMLALCEESVEFGKVSFGSSPPALKFKELYRLMYEECIRVVEQDVDRILDPIYSFLERSGRILPWLGIALMTDAEVYHLTKNGCGLLNSLNIMGTGLGEIIEKAEEVGDGHLSRIDPSKPDLDW